MKALLIGVDGQLGTDLKRTCPDDVSLTGLTQDDLDITHQASVLSIIKEQAPDLIINTAAYTRVDDAEENVDLAMNVNAIGVKHVSIAAQLCGARLVHISTDYVFDGGKVSKKEPYFEDDCPAPINTYGISKYAGELFAQSYCQRHYIVRLASLYGKAGAMGKGGNFVYTMLKLAKERKTVNVVNDIFMSPTYALDAAGMIWDIALSDREYGIYHVVNSGICSWYEFASEIISAVGLRASILPVSSSEFPTKARRPVWSPLASKKGITMRPWQEAVRDFLGDSLRGD